jgi:hypothetical protein
MRPSWGMNAFALCIAAQRRYPLRPPLPVPFRLNLPVELPPPHTFRGQGSAANRRGP